MFISTVTCLGYSLNPDTSNLNKCLIVSRRTATFRALPSSETSLKWLARNSSCLSFSSIRRNQKSSCRNIPCVRTRNIESQSVRPIQSTADMSSRAGGGGKREEHSITHSALTLSLSLTQFYPLLNSNSTLLRSRT